MTQETFKERQKRGLRPMAATITPDSEFAATHEGRMNTITELVTAPDGELQGRNGATAFPVTHITPEKVVMYKPDGRGHYSPRVVPATTINQNLASGFRSTCPECNGHHGGHPNDCPGREPIKERICTVCGKHVFDNMDLIPTAPPVGEARDPNVIYDDSYSASTPETRTKVLLDTHIWAKHPQSARIMNLTPLPEPSKEMLDAMVGSIRTQ